MANDQPERLLSWPLVQDRCGQISRSTLWRLRQDDDFPKPIALTAGRIAWRDSEINAWIASRPVTEITDEEEPT